MKPKRIESVIFDLDGVLVDSHEAIFSSIKDALARMSLEVRDGIFEILYKSHKEVFQRVYPERREDVGTFDDFYAGNAIHYTQVVLLKGARKTLQALRAKNLKLAIATTKDRRRTVRILERLGMRFDLILTSEDTPETRPDPAPLNLVVARLHLNKEETFYVGDTPLDIVQARNAGIASVAITTGVYKMSDLEKEHPDYIIDELFSLVDIIEGTHG